MSDDLAPLRAERDGWKAATEAARAAFDGLMKQYLTARGEAYGEGRDDEAAGLPLRYDSAGIGSVSFPGHAAAKAVRRALREQLIDELSNGGRPCHWCPGVPVFDTADELLTHIHATHPAP